MKRELFLDQILHYPTAINTKGKAGRGEKERGRREGDFSEHEEGEAA
jgi:hypothetical protein